MPVSLQQTCNCEKSEIFGFSFFWDPRSKKKNSVTFRTRPESVPDVCEGCSSDTSDCPPDMILESPETGQVEIFQTNPSGRPVRSMALRTPRTGPDGRVAHWHVAYPGREASLRGPKGRIWPDDFWKKHSLGDRTKDQAPTHMEVRRGVGTCDAPCVLRRVLDSAFVQARVRLSCSDSLIYTGRHTFRRHASPPRAAADGRWLNFSTVPQGRFFSNIIRPNASFGSPVGSLSSRVFIKSTELACNARTFFFWNPHC